MRIDTWRAAQEVDALAGSDNGLVAFSTLEPYTLQRVPETAVSELNRNWRLRAETMLNRHAIISIHRHARAMLVEE